MCVCVCVCSLGRGETPFALLEMPGPSTAQGFPTRDKGSQDLVKERTAEEAFQLQRKKVSLPLRLSLGRLSIALDERLHLVDSARPEQRSYQKV